MTAFTLTPEMVEAIEPLMHGVERRGRETLADRAIRAVAPLILVQAGTADAGLVKQLREAANELFVDGLPEDNINELGKAEDRIATLLREAADALKAQGVPEGFVMVPREPTQAMLDMVCSDEPHDHVYKDDNMRAVYKEMLSAAPSAPSQRQSAEAAQSASPPDESFVRVPVVKG